MNRYYYVNSISEFCIVDTGSEILGQLAGSQTFYKLDVRQISAWKTQIEILKNQLSGIKEHIYFAFSVPVMGKRVDNILLIGDMIFILEFKVGSDKFKSHNMDQNIEANTCSDFYVDLKNIYKATHFQTITGRMI
jgi:hypothetical protein